MMWIIYDIEGTPIGILNENAIKHTTIPELLMGEGDCLILPINPLTEEETEKAFHEQWERRHKK